MYMKLPILGCNKRKNEKNFFKCYKCAENRRDAVLIAGAIYIAPTVLYRLLVETAGTWRVVLGSPTSSLPMASSLAANTLVFSLSADSSSSSLQKVNHLTGRGQYILVRKLCSFIRHCLKGDIIRYRTAYIYKYFVHPFTLHNPKTTNEYRTRLLTFKRAQLTS
jgi:hypothetical protein